MTEEDKKHGVFDILNDPYLLDLSKRIMDVSNNKGELELNFNDYHIVFVQYIKDISKDKINLVSNTCLNIKEYNDLINMLLEIKYNRDKFRKLLSENKEQLMFLKSQYLIGKNPEETIREIITDVSTQISNSINSEISDTEKKDKSE